MGPGCAMGAGATAAALGGERYRGGTRAPAAVPVGLVPWAGRAGRHAKPRLAWGGWRTHLQRAPTTHLPS